MVLVDVDGFVNKCSSLLKTRVRPFVLCSSILYNIACMYDYLWTHLGPPTPSISRQGSMCSWVVSSTTNTSSILGPRTVSFTSGAQGQGPPYQEERRLGQGGTVSILNPPLLLFMAGL